jgi:hypothetical protein
MTAYIGVFLSAFAACYRALRRHRKRWTFNEMPAIWLGPGQRIQAGRKFPAKAGLLSNSTGLSIAMRRLGFSPCGRCLRPAGFFGLIGVGWR